MTLQPFVEQVFRVFSVPVFSFERWLPFSCPKRLATRRLKISRLVAESISMDELVASVAWLSALAA
ncbi:MAG: hypothetical protein KAX99_10245 [Azonexus sp.]|nr:hypothetical protein [Azonexus sp.]